LNVRGAFTVFDPAAVAGKHILLVDDILTTGATARAAAKTLMEAGADSVWVATLARARRFGYQRGTFILYDDVEENSDLASNALAATMHEAFTYSSHDQPSF
jgi:orotate phosphoribosyltransferase